MLAPTAMVLLNATSVIFDHLGPRAEVILIRPSRHKSWAHNGSAAFSASAALPVARTTAPSASGWLPDGAAEQEPANHKHEEAATCALLDVVQ